MKKSFIAIIATVCMALAACDPEFNEDWRGPLINTAWQYVESFPGGYESNILRFTTKSEGTLTSQYYSTEGSDSETIAFTYTLSDPEGIITFAEDSEHPESFRFTRNPAAGTLTVYDDDGQGTVFTPLHE